MNQEQQIFFTSDQHYYHNNIIRFTNRPFDSVQHMNQALVDNHNAVVDQFDRVYHLGDFAFTNLDNIVTLFRRLNGYHFFVRGNHDKGIVNAKRKLLDEGVIQLFAQDEEITFRGQFIVLHHYGKRVWNKAHHGSWHLFGHSHGTLPPYGRSVDVGVDSAWITGKPEYRPFSFNEIEAYMATRDFKSEDRHQEP